MRSRPKDLCSRRFEPIIDTFHLTEFLLFIAEGGDRNPNSFPTVGEAITIV